MRISAKRLGQLASETGFRVDALEKAVRLMDLLNQIFENPYLKSRLVLKGGTALNLFIFDIPRLSVDIDLNYIGAINLVQMQEDRPKLEAEILGICRLSGFAADEIPLDDHAGGKWRLGYQNAFGSPASLELDLNYMHRIKLCAAAKLDSNKLGSYQSLQIPVLDIRELTSGKLSALLTRNASRDLFDTSNVLKEVDVGEEEFRLVYVLYAAMNPRVDWRNVTPDNISTNLPELRRRLVPLLRNGDLVAKKDDQAFVGNLINECKMLIAPLFPLHENEYEFISRLRDRGEIQPILLTSKADMIEKIQQHPALLRRANQALK